MNFDEYFARRNELAMRVLVEVPDGETARSDWPFLGIGAGCLFTAVASAIWASQALDDPGYFARTATFLTIMLIAGACTLIAGKVADAWLSRSRVGMREMLKERTVARLIRADSMVARGLADVSLKSE